ncbi:glycoside hydrolase family 3 protein [Dactylonectria macrodidyma]|uniref:beta-glucosidase n=1 Tax=Dactylonectria macrodidyma TaxID=307937 RepID=A0A9P9E5D8_9HYPO|nr:glycoside hydrolase family 3 protein [Dactylonectria macrodidyma]
MFRQDNSSIHTSDTTMSWLLLNGIELLENSPTVAPLGRTPWDGRLSVAFAIDSYLSGIAFGLSVKAEHFLLYEQENNRSTSVSNTWGYGSFDAIAGDKVIHDTYLSPWYDGVKNGLGAAMCAMNLVNGTYSCENEPLLMGLLKTELGFPAGSVNGGLDWATNSVWSPAIIEAMVKVGNVTTARLIDMAIRNIIGWYHSNIHNGSFPSKAAGDEYRPISKSMVLLKNIDSALPLKSPRPMSLFGAHAGPSIVGPNRTFALGSSDPGGAAVPEVWMGHMASLDGAGASPMPYLITPLQSLTERAIEDGTQLRWIANDTFAPVTEGLIPSGARMGVLPSFETYATHSDVCLAFPNAFGGEGHDRRDLRDSDQDERILKVAAYCNNTIVTTNSVGTQIVKSWINHDNVTAVLYGGPLGQESGNSIADVLYGNMRAVYNARPCPTLKCEFDKGNYIDYKHFGKYDIEPRFEFGFGLSYTTFEYSDMTINITAKAGLAQGIRAVGGRADLWTEGSIVTAKVTNTGEVAGADVVRLYLSFPEEADQPVHQLRRFEPVNLAPGESADVEFRLRQRDMSYWDVIAQEWRIAGGTYVFSIGHSSRNLELTEERKIGHSR